MFGPRHPGRAQTQMASMARQLGPKRPGEKGEVTLMPRTGQGKSRE